MKSGMGVRRRCRGGGGRGEWWLRVVEDWDLGCVDRRGVMRDGEGYVGNVLWRCVCYRGEV